MDKYFCSMIQTNQYIFGFLRRDGLINIDKKLLAVFFSINRGQKRVLQRWGFEFGLFHYEGVLDESIYHYSHQQYSKCGYQNQLLFFHEEILNRRKRKINNFLPSYKVFVHKKLLLLLFSISLFLFCQLVFTCFVFFPLPKLFLKK